MVAQLMHSLNFPVCGTNFPSITSGAATSRSSLWGRMPKKQLVIEQLRHPNYIKRALYYQELLETGQVQSQRALAEHSGISQTKVHSILKLLQLDEEIKDFMLNLDDADSKMDFLAVYRLQPLLRLNNKEQQRKRFWEMIGTG